MNVRRAFERHHPALRRYLVRFTGDREEAADVVQESYLRLIEAPPDHEDAVRTWLFQVATNVARDRARRRQLDVRVRRLVGEGRLVADAPLDPHAALEHRERERAVHRMLAVLSERERAIVLLREEGLTHRDIAAAVGTTTSSIGTVLARALKKLARVNAHRAEDLL